MEDFRFYSPEFLLLLAGLPALAFMLARARRGALKKLAVFASHKSLKRLLKLRTPESEKLRTWLLWTGLTLAILALARPQANPEIEERESSSLDILVLLDVSRSMDAEDAPPSRLKQAKRTVSEMMDKLSGDRVGVVAFAGSAFLVSPLTSDYDMVRSFLQSVDSSIISNQGTDIGSALELASRAMERGSQAGGSEGARSNIFLVLSDGEDHYQVSADKAASLNKKGGVVYAIAYGTERGAPIPMRNERGESVGFKRDKADNTVMSAVNAKSLQAIASAGGGQFYFSTSDGSEILDFLKRTQGMQREGGATIKARIYQEYFFPLLVLAGIFLVLSSIKIPLMKSRTGKPLILALLFLPLVSHAGPLEFLDDKTKRAYEASETLAKEGKPEDAAASLREQLAENPDSGPLNYNVGTYLLGAKKFNEARGHLERAKKSPDTKWKAAYNIAGSYVAEEKKDDARAAYSALIAEVNSGSDTSPEAIEAREKSRIALQQLAEDNKQDNKQDPKNQDQKEQEKKDQDKKDESQPDSGKKEQKDDKSGAGQKDPKEEEKKDQGQEKKEEPKNPGEEEKKDEAKTGEKKENDGGQQQAPQAPGKGRAKFRERDNMSEEDAKKIIEALKLQENSLQKRFLKYKEKDADKIDDNGKDW